MKIGHTVMTRGIANKAADNVPFAKDLSHSLALYLQKNWGDISENDKEMNDLNVKSDVGSLMGAYETCEGRIWIMTEHDRSVTTILFPHEY